MLNQLDATQSATIIACVNGALGGERHYESKVFCPRTQYSMLARAQTWNVGS